MFFMTFMIWAGRLTCSVSIAFDMSRLDSFFSLDLLKILVNSENSLSKHFCAAANRLIFWKQRVRYCHIVIEYLY